MVPTLLEWVAMLAVGERWSPIEGEREAAESGGEKGWWLAQMVSSTPAEKDEWAGVAWVDMGMARTWARSSCLLDLWRLSSSQRSSKRASGRHSRRDARLCVWRDV